MRRARSRAALLVLLAVVVSGTTAYAAWRVVHRYEAEIEASRKEAEAHRVVVAARDLAPGTILTAADLAEGSAPSDVDAAHVFPDRAAVLGKVVGDRVLAGEAIRLERLTVGGANLRLNEVIAPGARAVTVRASRSSAVGGLLRPGYFVDVIVTIKPDTDQATERMQWVTETVLQSVRVVAVDDHVSSAPGAVDDPEEDKKRRASESFVTLEVQPAEAEQLALASARGELHLSLRAREDYELVADDGPLVTRELVGVPAPVAKAQVLRVAHQKEVAALVTPQPTVLMDVIRGTRITTEHLATEAPAGPAASRP